MKADIKSRDDLDFLIRKFYSRLLKEDEMRHIFLEVMQLDLEAHFPKLIDFWDSALFFTAKYRDNAMLKHLKIHGVYTLNKTHFELWLDTFNQTVDEYFEGAKAQLAKQRAFAIATLMQHKMGI